MLFCFYVYHRYLPTPYSTNFYSKFRSNSLTRKFVDAKKVQTKSVDENLELCREKKRKTIVKKNYRKQKIKVQTSPKLPGF